MSRQAGVQYVPSTTARSGAARSIARVPTRVLDRNSSRCTVGKGVRAGVGDMTTIGVGVRSGPQAVRPVSRVSKTQAATIVVMLRPHSDTLCFSFNYPYPCGFMCSESNCRGRSPCLPCPLIDSLSHQGRHGDLPLLLFSTHILNTERAAS